MSMSIKVARNTLFDLKKVAMRLVTSLKLATQLNADQRLHLNQTQLSSKKHKHLAFKQLPNVSNKWHSLTEGLKLQSKIFVVLTTKSSNTTMRVGLKNTSLT